MKFSLLMSIYCKEKPEYFDRCMQSIWDEQNAKPNEIVLVEDGKLTPELYEVIEKWEGKIGNILVRVPLEKNLGTGKAKNKGLQKCKYNIVAIMDTDDIARSDRFEKQLKIIEADVDVCSSWIGEFENKKENIVSYRKLPKNHKEIVKFAKKRMPVNHPSTMYKKEFALKAGGYKHMLWFEDYYLMVRMILNGAKFYNIQEPLVKMRAGFSQLDRRRGLNYIKAEVKFLTTLKKEGFLSNYEFIRNLIVRLIARSMPKRVLKSIYKRLRD